MTSHYDCRKSCIRNRILKRSRTPTFQLFILAKFYKLNMVIAFNYFGEKPLIEAAPMILAFFQYHTLSRTVKETTASNTGVTVYYESDCQI